jgi:hypothetical protein
MTLAVLCLAVAAAPAGAAGLRLKGGPRAENALRVFVRENPKLQARLAAAAEREKAFLAAARDPDLRDSVAAAPDPGALKAELAAASGARRWELLSGLPGVQAPAPADCLTLSSCATPELAADAADAGSVPDALRRLVRPWMLLQQARGSSVTLVPADGPGDAVLAVELKGRHQPTLTLNVTPCALGGFKVWYGEPFVLASLYGRERDAALSGR